MTNPLREDLLCLARLDPLKRTHHGRPFVFLGQALPSLAYVDAMPSGTYPAFDSVRQLPSGATRRSMRDASWGPGASSSRSPALDCAPRSSACQRPGMPLRGLSARRLGLRRWGRREEGIGWLTRC
jgi:hypothetical protein